jgi:hypothetical protein
VEHQARQNRDIYTKKTLEVKINMEFSFIIELPGAIIRWIMGRILQKNKSIQDYLGEDSMNNFFIGISFWFLLIIMYNIMKGNFHDGQ